MKHLAHFIGTLTLLACSSDRDALVVSQRTDGGAEGAGEMAGAASTATDGGAGGETSAQGTGTTCSDGTMPADAPNFAMRLFGEGASSYYDYAPPTTLAVNGHVLVERIARNQSVYIDSAGQRVFVSDLFLVSESNQRISISVVSPKLPLEKLMLGSKLWLSASVLIERGNPYSHHRISSFTLRATEDGPVLLSAIQGKKPQGDAFLGSPATAETWCSSTTMTGRKSLTTGSVCSTTVERFEVRLGTEPSVSIRPGNAIQLLVSGNAYDVALWSAEYTSYVDTGCSPSDWEPSVTLSLEGATRDWDGQVASVPVAAAELPTCHLGSDAPPFILNVEELNWDLVVNGSAESAMTLKSSTGDTVEFDLGTMGTLSATGLSAEGRAIFEQGRWFSKIDSGNDVIRDGQDGRVLAVVASGSVSTLTAFASRSDVLGWPIAVEPRCEWMSAACRGLSGVESLSLYDVFYGDSADHRVASHMRTVVNSTNRQFDAWVAVAPSCQADPQVEATFLAAQ